MPTASVLQPLSQQWKDPSDLPAGMASILSELLEQALTTGDHQTLRSLRDDIVALQQRLLDAAPADTIDAIVDAPTTPHHKAIAAAFHLGQINLTQVLAAQASEHMVDTQFLQAMQAQAYRPYIEALRNGDLSNSALQPLCGDVTETVSRKLKALRALGITDVRRDGKLAINFLTPAARDVLATQVQETRTQRTGAGHTPAHKAFVQRLFERTPDNFKHAPNFARG